MSDQSKANFTSKSTCGLISSFYERILANEFTDTDFWYSGGGDELNYSLSKFDNGDWGRLEEDISNWKMNQLEILCIILTRDDSHWLTSSVFKEQFQSKKSELYALILNICDDDLFIDLIDYFEFLKLNIKPDAAIMNNIKYRLLKLEDSSFIENSQSSRYFYTRKRYESFLQIIDEKISK